MTYAFRVAVGLASLVVVFYAFSRVHERDTTIIVAVLGVVYASSRATALAQGLALAHAYIALSHSLGGLRQAAGLSRLHPSKDEEAAFHRLKVLSYLDKAFYTVITLVCLYRLVQVV